MTLTVSEPGASIAYTVGDDTAEPARWQLYTGPVALAASTTLRARAIRYAWAKSDEVRATFSVSSAP